MGNFDFEWTMNYIHTYTASEIKAFKNTSNTYTWSLLRKTAAPTATILGYLRFALRDADFGCNQSASGTGRIQ